MEVSQVIILFLVAIMIIAIAKFGINVVWDLSEFVVVVVAAIFIIILVVINIVIEIVFWIGARIVVGIATFFDNSL